MIDVNASDIVLALEKIQPLPDNRTYTGDLTGIDTSDSRAEAGFMFGDLSIEQMMDFNMDSLLADYACYNPGIPLVASIKLPDNIFVPRQPVAPLINAAKKSYASAPIVYGDHYLTGISGKLDLADAQSGDIYTILQGFDFEKIGARNELVDASSVAAGFNIDMSANLTENVSCMITGAPAESDVFCLMLGDWDSSAGAALTPGAGRLFLMGLGLGETPANGAGFAITGVTTVANTGLFQGIEYVGVSVASYIDAAAAPSADTARGMSIIARRNNPITAAGGTLAFDDYLPIRTLTRTGRTFSASAVAPGAGIPVAHFSRTAIRQEISETYQACAQGDSVRTIYRPLWIVYADGARNQFTLPTLPAAWPRGGEGGLIDAAATTEDDVLNWTHATVHEGLNGSFSYDAMQFGEIPRTVTHVSTNEQDF
jgi:hypothetical protein